MGPIAAWRFAPVVLGPGPARHTEPAYGEPYDILRLGEYLQHGDEPFDVGFVEFIRQYAM